MASQSMIVCANYDLTAAATTYLTMSQDTIRGDVPIATTGSSATTTGTNAFVGIGVGDQLSVGFGDGTYLNRTITAKATDSSVTVHAVWDLTGGFHHRWRDLNTGTTAGFGWYDISSMTDVRVVVDLQTLTGTNITLSIEVKDEYSTSPVVVQAPVLTTAGQTSYAIPEGYPRVRVGALVTGDAGTQNLNIAIVGNAVVAA